MIGLGCARVGRLSETERYVRPSDTYVDAYNAESTYQTNLFSATASAGEQG